jgi:hypothetical protein
MMAALDQWGGDHFPPQAQWKRYYASNLVACKFGAITGLRTHPAVINKIIRSTIYSKSGNVDVVRELYLNFIDCVMGHQKFNVVGLILKNVEDIHHKDQIQLKPCSVMPNQTWIDMDWVPIHVTIHAHDKSIPVFFPNSVKPGLDSTP